MGWFSDIYKKDTPGTAIGKIIVVSAAVGATTYGAITIYRYFRGPVEPKVQMDYIGQTGEPNAPQHDYRVTVTLPRSDKTDLERENEARTLALDTVNAKHPDAATVGIIANDVDSKGRYIFTVRVNEKGYATP